MGGHIWVRTKTNLKKSWLALPNKESEEILATRDKKTFITLKQTRNKKTIDE